MSFFCFPFLPISFFLTLFSSFSLLLPLFALFFSIITSLILSVLLLPLALQPTVSFGLSNNVLPFFPICHQLSSFSHSQHFKISLYFLFPSSPGSSPSSRPVQFYISPLVEKILYHYITFKCAVMLSDFFHIVSSYMHCWTHTLVLYLNLGMFSRSRDESCRQVDCLLSYVHQWHRPDSDLCIYPTVLVGPTGRVIRMNILQHSGKKMCVPYDLTLIDFERNPRAVYVICVILRINGSNWLVFLLDTQHF